jgi:hypothetical protein
MRNLLTKISMAVFAAMASAGAMAGNFTQVPDPASVAQGATVNVAFQFAGDTVTQEAQLDLNYNSTVFTTVVPTTVVVGSTCAVNPTPPFIRIIPPSGAGTALTSTPTTYCSFAFTAAPGATLGNYDFTTRTLECDGPSCTRTGTFRITVTGAGPTPVGPSIAYNPAAGAAAGTGGPVNFTGVTTIGSTGAGQIVATPSGGAVAGTTTTVGSFTLSGADAANFAVTSAATLTFTQGTSTAQNINMTCTSGAAARTANLQATETITGGATSQRFWVLSCPAGSAVMATPPTITYAPAINSSTSIPAGSSTNINVGCPTDGANCNGTGTGLAATSRLENLRATYAGPMFSPVPTMACQFVSEAGGAVSSPRDYVALGADQGDISCTCPANTTGLPTEPFTVQVDERIPANSAAITATRNFTIVCGGPPPVCGTATYANQAPGATINLNNGGAAVQVSAASLVGASLNVNQTITCVTSNVSAGSTFGITTTPTPLVISTNPLLGGTISATCTNSATTAGTATLTCTGTSATPSCASTATFTLSCPGQGVPPPPTGEFVAVPSLNEQGRILLAALVLLLGLGVVGFRMRG